MFPEVKNFLLCIETGVNSYQEDQGSDLSLCAPVRLGHGKCYYIFLAFLRYRINFSASKKWFGRNKDDFKKLLLPG